MNIFVVTLEENYGDDSDYYHLKYSFNKEEAEKFKDDLDKIINLFRESQFELKTKQLEVAKFTTYKNLCMEYENNIDHLKDKEEMYKKQLFDLNTKIENILNLYNNLSIKDLKIEDIHHYTIRVIKVESI